jgi:hypothetical protein
MRQKLFMIAFMVASVVALCGWLFGLTWGVIELIRLI